MNRKETAQLLAILKAAYPNHYRDMSAEDAQGTVSVWSMQFADMPAEIVLMALNKVISTSKYPPTVAEVKEKFSSIHWEAYEKIDRHNRFKNLSDGEVAMYKRIYTETERYKHGKQIEPSINTMLTSREVKQLQERNE